MTHATPLLRQWTLLKTLASRNYGLTVSEMVEETGVSVKTVRRDLETFQSVGFPLEETVGERGRKTYRLTPSWRQPEIGFTFEEAAALYLGRHLLEPLAGTIFWRSAHTAFRKIRASLKESAVEYLEKIAASIHQTTVGTSDYSTKQEVVDQLMVGLEDCRIVCLEYQSLRATEPVTYDVFPYGMTYHRGSLYLIAHSPKHGEIRHFKVDRIEGAESTQLPFSKPNDFDVADHLAPSFGVMQGDGQVEVAVRFSPTVARYVKESRWHDGQELIDQKDGSVLARFLLSDTEEIKTWILSFGRHAVVLHPEDLRNEIVEEIALIRKQYKPQEYQKPSEVFGGSNGTETTKDNHRTDRTRK